jgi:shikimate kinase
MTLRKAALAAALQKAFEDATDKKWEAPEVANALANAIDAYVRSMEVKGVTVTGALDAETTTVSSHKHGVKTTVTAMQNNTVKLG